MADKAKMGMGSKEEEKIKDLLRETMGKKLAGLIPVVEAGMHDLKAEVRLKRRDDNGQLMKMFRSASKQ